MSSEKKIHDPFDLEAVFAEASASAKHRSTGRTPFDTLRLAQKVQGIYRVGLCLDRIAQNSRNYRVVQLHDGASFLRCYCWMPELINAPRLAEGAIVDATFVTYEYQGLMRGKLSALTLVADPSSDDVIATLPSTLCVIPGVVERLREAVRAIREPLLKEVVARAFRDYAFAKRYFSVPASIDDHHKGMGGHASHSTEMGVDASKLTSLPIDDRDFVIVLSLFHDVGKTQTHDPEQQARKLHRILNHETLTLYLLADALRWLEERWPDGAMELKIGWNLARLGGNPKEQPVTVASKEYMRGLDRASRARDMQQTHAPANGGLYETTRGRAMWRRSPPPSRQTELQSDGHREHDGSAASR